MLEIARSVAERHGLTLADLKGPARSPTFARPRQEAMALIRQLTDHSLPKIGGFFNRDHTTVLHACRRHAERVEAARLAEQERAA
jgi:chromosomal replication initiator protein